MKQFKNQGLKRRLDRTLRGSKAERSWRGAAALAAAGIPTADPVMLVESRRSDGPSLFVSRRLQDAHEVRHFFRRLRDDPSAGEFPRIEAPAMLGLLGSFCRKVHDAGVWYRDLSMGNVLVRRSADGELEMYLVDCNRARIGRRMGLVRRSRDLCRFPIVRQEHREAFLKGYWGELPSPSDPKWWIYTASVRGYLLKHAVKNRLKTLKRVGRHDHGGSHHPHIPNAREGAASRDKAVWDHLSDQPHQHAGRWEKRWIRLMDAPEHVRDLAAGAVAAPGVWRRYRRLQGRLHSAAVRFDGAGVCLRPYPEDPEAHLRAVEDLGVRRVMIRLHPWASDHGDEENLARELHSRGHEIAFALPQNRDLVRDPERWRSAVEEIAERFTPYGRHFQVGQAPNRSKWGIWTRGEFIDLYVGAAEILRRREGVEVMGPSVIDSEFQVTLALANRRRRDLRFDPLSSLLYVDRRGAPENSQLGLDTVNKVVLLRAIAETGRNCSDRLWITEVNWPLWEGPHSPAGKSVSVDEQAQADYLVRYYLLTLGTGLVERVYWWRMVARGYGLVDPEGHGALRRRPSFAALAHLHRSLGGSVFLGPLPSAEGSYCYRFDAAGRQLVVGWSLEPGRREELPARPAGAVDRDGRELPTPDGPEVELGPSPVYYFLD